MAEFDFATERAMFSLAYKIAENGARNPPRTQLDWDSCLSALKSLYSQAEGATAAQRALATGLVAALTDFLQCL